MNKDRSLKNTPNMNSSKFKGTLELTKSQMNTQRTNNPNSVNLALDIGRISFTDSVFPHSKF